MPEFREPTDTLHVAACRAALLRYARRRLDAATAEDVVQETLLAALSSRLRDPVAGTLQGWLFGILKHKIIDAVRGRAREVRLDWSDDLVTLAEDADGMAGMAPGGLHGLAVRGWSSPEAALMQTQFLAVLGTGIDRLPDSWCEVFLMREVGGMDTQEVCTHLGITTNNCFVLLHRARQRLRAHLLSEGFGSAALLTE